MEENFSQAIEKTKSIFHINELTKYFTFENILKIAEKIGIQIPNIQIGQANNTKYLLIVDDIMKIIKVYDTNSYPIIHKYPIKRCSIR